MTLKFLARSKRFSQILMCVFFTIVSFKAQAYVKFNSAPTEGWGEILEKSGVERYYEVQGKDSLYDISRALFGDSSFWPKIWSINSGITNPHLIERGAVIYFSGGSQLEPPKFGVEAMKASTYTYGANFLKPSIPPAPFNKGVAQIPEAFKNYFSSEGQKEDEAQKLKSISSGLRQARLQKRKILITSEVLNSKPKSIGRITRVQTGGTIARTGSLVTLKFKKGSTPNIGDSFTAFNYNKETFVYKKEGVETGLVEWLGTLKVTAHSNKNEYFAEVINSNDLLPIGAQLSLEKMVVMELPDDINMVVSDARVNQKLEIIGAHKVGNANVVGESSIVYVKGGSQAGLSENEVYPIFENFGRSILDKNTTFKPKSIGFIKIAKTSKKFSTGVVFKLSRNVTSGSLLGQID